MNQRWGQIGLNASRKSVFGYTVWVADVRKNCEAESISSLECRDYLRIGIALGG